MTKKKNRPVAVLAASVVVLLCVGVPIWLLMIAIITGSVLVSLLLICWVSISWLVARRFE